MIHPTLTNINILPCYAGKVKNIVLKKAIIYTWEGIYNENSKNFILFKFMIGLKSNGGEKYEHFKNIYRSL
ncbi:hypothetical protein LBYZC6_50350 [Lacrimispora brassicae]